MTLEFKNLSKHFKDKKAVDDLNIEIHEGVNGLLGANGAGKTTLMKMLVGNSKPSSGAIYFDGQEINKMGEDYRNILGYLPQDFRAYLDFTALGFLKYIVALKAVPLENAEKRCMELLEQMNLADVAHKKIRTFSGGMKKRLGIAQVLLNDPKILIVDEPTTGLDPKERIKFRNIINSISENKIILLSTHIVSDIENVAKNILVMKDGKIILNGTLEELTKQYDNKAWICEVSQQDFERINEKYYVSASRRNPDNSIETRVVADEKPHETAKQVSASLEDIYLYNFKELSEV